MAKDGGGGGGGKHGQATHKAYGSGVPVLSSSIR